MSRQKKPRIAVLPGDPCGVGPELAAKLLAEREMLAQAQVIALGDRRIFQMGETLAGVSLEICDIHEIEALPSESTTLFCLDYPSMAPEDVTRGKVNPKAGASVYKTLLYALELAQSGAIDGFVFAPFNKKAMHLGGCPFESEFMLFLDFFQIHGVHGEINVLDELWTTRVSSHIALKDVVECIQQQRIFETIRHLHQSLQRYGLLQPKIAVTGLNPHCGEEGMFGREELDEIGPAVEQAKSEGMNVVGPYPADTIFLRREKEQFNGIISMYHDQGQVATKLLGFDRGVTVHGGLPVPITTPSHGTAFDIAGKGIAHHQAICNAFNIAVQMAQGGRST
ncbi:4-hydroxythreonine-4-phosphate dehydrogenase [candidate division KSB3 bacterium]|uniref:4-hydroxythreonine-4-phosphate dehydrogenase n=1 Tax=candidate division KSB3 bacterium TaxID=2044937 RepID=A0A2G6E1A4_9BACT|nr:MAG: 4-hydroxythreonine-4-phosphate dehydrogenase [candidate division KSB3 bacterium]PIE28475.1 MAG: 4-hydroxythreonine-4-phosphate dehydrogenase [candidate division KSB3 bacterium]